MIIQAGIIQEDFLISSSPKCSIESSSRNMVIRMNISTGVSYGSLFFLRDKMTHCLLNSKTVAMEKQYSLPGPKAKE